MRNSLGERPNVRNKGYIGLDESYKTRDHFHARTKPSHTDTLLH